MENTNIDYFKLKKFQIEILRNFIEFCATYELKYFLVYGSALGAYRHSGFIPWDDDIDIGMPRSDYENLLFLWKNSEDSKFFLQTYESDNSYPLLYGKIRINKTVFLEPYFKHLPMHHGIFIDIFPIDGVANNKLERFYNFLLLRIARRLILRKLDIKGKSRLFEFILLVTAFFFSLNYLRDVANKILIKFPYEKSLQVSCLATEEVIVEKMIYGDGAVKKFEGIEVILPEKIESYLELMYGDYMKVPESIKKPHHNVDDVKFYI